jgi:hypothetical protein
MLDRGADPDSPFPDLFSDGSAKITHEISPWHSYLHELLGRFQSSVDSETMGKTEVPFLHQLFEHGVDMIPRS